MIGEPQSIAGEWTEFSRRLPENYSYNQREAMRIAFYAGAQGILFLLTSQVDDLNQELEDFTKKDLQ